AGGGGGGGVGADDCLFDLGRGARGFASEAVDPAGDAIVLDGAGFCAGGGGVVGGDVAGADHGDRGNERRGAGFRHAGAAVIHGGDDEQGGSAECGVAEQLDRE